MRILFATYAEKTHFWAMVPLAWALQSAGHEVRVATQPALLDTVTGAGLSAVAVGRNHTLYDFVREVAADADGAEEDDWFDFAENDPAVLTPEHLDAGYDQVVLWWWRAFNDSMIDDLVTVAKRWQPDLIVWEAITFAGPVAAAVTGAAHARYVWGADLFTRMRRRHLAALAARGAAPREDVLAYWLGARAGRYGAHFNEDMTTGQFTIDAIPDSLRLRPGLGLDLGLDYLPVRPVSYNGGSVVEPWLRTPPARPRVCLTLGVSATDRPIGYSVSTAELLDALADLDVEVVATLPDAERAKLARVPANARVTAFVPLNVLAATCSVVIHHGGIGTYNTCLLAGVPQFVVPTKLFDLGVRAEHLAAEGAGLAVPPTELTPDLVRSGVSRLIGDPSFRANAARLRAEILALPSPNDAVTAIEERVSRHRAESLRAGGPTVERSFVDA